MERYYFIFLSFLLSMMIFSCKDLSSDLDQITATKMTCDVNKQKAEYYYQKYGSKLEVNSKVSLQKIAQRGFGSNYPTTSKNPEETKKLAFERLSNVPDEYLKYIFEEQNIPVHIIDYLVNNSGIGLTRHYVKNNIQYPQIIFYSHPKVFAHEFGHASEGYHWKLYPEFSKELTKLASRLQQPDYSSKRSAYLRSYDGADKTYLRDRETFAELFDTWYCSKAARTKLKEGLLDAYNFAQKYLISPLDEEETKDVNLYVANNGNTFKIYLSNHTSHSNISYCIDKCENKVKASSFKNNSSANIFASEEFTVKSSSFTLQIYGDDSLIRKVSISK